MLVLQFTDVSQDPTAPARARIRPEQIAEARALGFDHLAWVAAIPRGLPEGFSGDENLLLSNVLAHESGGSILELTRWGEIDDAGVRTLFQDGTVVVTGRIPDKGWWKLRWGLAGAPHNGYDLTFVKVGSIRELVTIHEARVQAHLDADRRPVAHHDLRAYLATRKRWREIADPRMRVQESIATKMGFATMVGVAIGAVVGGRALGLAPLAIAASMLLAIGLGIAVFLGALYFVAPVLARGTKVPAPRPARELLALADSVPRGRLPAPGREPAASEAKKVAISSAELARLQRVDLAIAISNAIVLPLAGVVGTVLVGTAAIPIALGIVFTTDGVLALLTKKTRGQMLRERLVPALVRAEDGLGCATGACATPAGRRVLGIAWLLGGIASLIAARGALIAGSTAAPAWLLCEWAGLVLVAAAIASITMKKRHKRLAAA